MIYKPPPNVISTATAKNIIGKMVRILNVFHWEELLASPLFMSVYEKNQAKKEHLKEKIENIFVGIYLFIADYCVEDENSAKNERRLVLIEERSVEKC